MPAIKPLGALFAAGLALVAGSAKAVENNLYLSVYADRTVPYIEPETGRAHAFLCLSRGAQVTPQDECFGFFPRPEAVTSLVLKNGDQLTRTVQDWVESPGGFRFIQQPSPADNIVLFDSTRQMTWQLSFPRGGSLLQTPAGRQPWRPVIGITFGADAPAFIGGNGPADQYQEIVGLPQATNVTYQRVITPLQRDAVIAAIADWNAGPHRLNQDNYVDAIARVSARLGLRLPHRTPHQAAADYVDALSKIN
jgi:hypothetical protein